MNQDSIDRMESEEHNKMSRLDKHKSSLSESTSISPYEYLAAQLRIQEQRQNQCMVKQFALEDSKQSPSQPGNEKYFVIQEEEEENSRIQFGQINEKYSTIQYKQGASFHHQDAENSDILIKEWLVSPEKSDRKKKYYPFVRKQLPFHLLDKENKVEEKYQLKSHFLFNTRQSCIKEISSNGNIKKIQKFTEIRKGISLMCKGKRK